ncbi:oxidoreductase [Novimethylophilus kurashikiensis]|uniref:Oxidoreductase n=1 Tax=Novimethylophilus kurashikiensis TaxID=1825523 RepID=A0A2R5FE24_9PROT|nr:Gfo/Idh/MocA family oxidoreductase [Novimethylophilus kurashikiensis]GBG15959.1 oxidoreductase [Novimethylophilus kurashikiensis]
MPHLSEAKPLSLGFIGGALSSAVGYAHYVSSTMDNQWTVEAGCFATEAHLNKETGQAYGIEPERVYDSWQDLLRAERKRIDAIVVLTPTPLHFEIVTACLEAGIPVICEKALAVSSGEVETIIDVRNRNKGFVAVTYNYSGYPMVRELRQIIQSGKLGNILHFQVEMPQEGFVRVDASGNKPMPQEWRLHDGKIPTIYLDLAVHLHHLVQYLTEQAPIEVVTDQNSYGWFSEVVDNVNCLCRYTGGVQGQLWFSKSALGHRNGLRLRIYGSKASVEWYQANPEEVLVSYSDGRREIIDRASPVEVANLKRYNRFKAGHPAGFVEAFANLYQDMADCIRQYKKSGIWHSQNVFDAETALEGLYLLEAMATSAESKSWQPVRSKS